MPQTLCVEGPDRDQLIAGIRATYGQSTVITDVTTVRRGGVGGFFARELVRVSFQPAFETPISTPVAMPTPVAVPTESTMAVPGPDGPAPAMSQPPAVLWPPMPVPSLDPPGRHRATTDVEPEPAGLAALLDSADRADGPQPSAANVAAAETTFAALLASLTPTTPAPTTPASTTPAPPPPAPPAPTLEPPVVLTPTTMTPPLPPVEPSGPPPRLVGRPGVDVRSRVEMLSSLRAVGIPVADNPKTAEVSLYRAIEQIVDELPPPPPLPDRAGAVVVVIGAPDQVLTAAAIVATRMRLAPAAIWRTGPAAVGSTDRVLAGPMDATTRRAEIREATTPSVIAIEVDNDRAGDRFGWAPQLVAALAPDAVWAAVDAGRKVEDLRAELSTLGPIDALVVSGATRTSSPATVWDLDIPIALLDGRSATAGTWAGLLFDALREAS